MEFNSSDIIAVSSANLYPMLFKANRKTLVWGTEDWTVSCVPDSESVIDNGALASHSLAEVIACSPESVLGKQTAARYNSQLPLLTKIIVANQDLSIQVHPNDEMARREHNKFGKSEMWYVLDAKPGAYLYAGFRQQITPEEYKRRVADGTITEVLAKHEVRKGDVFYLPAGRVHAICGGIKLAEVQQSSDVTYRIFDYNRPGLDGKPRELHTELAAKAIDYEVYPEYKTSHSNATEKANIVLNTPYFSIKVVETSRPFHRDMIKYDSFIIIMNIGADCRIKIRATGDVIALPADVSCFIPASIADYDIIPGAAPTKDEGQAPQPPKGGVSADELSAPTKNEGRKTAKVLEAFINNKKSIGSIISDFFRM